MSVTPFTRDPAHGHDPWIGPGVPPSEQFGDDHEAALAALQPQAAALYRGADTIGGDIGLLPDGLDAYMSYVDNYGGWSELVARFAGKAWLGSITIFGGPAVIADVESGAMSPGSFPGWYDSRALRDPHGNIWGYSSASQMQSVIDAAAGRPFIRWSAHFGSGPHICGPSTCGYPQAHWTQWDDHGPQGQNMDRSVGTYLPTALPPPPPKAGEKPMIAVAMNANGCLEVFAEAQPAGPGKCGLVYHTYQEKDPAGHITGWVGSHPGVVAEWIPMGTPGG